MSSPAFIWDMDGTLIDSYPIIVSSALQALTEAGIPTDQETIFREVTATSVSDFVRQIAREHHLDEAALLARCSHLQTSRDDQVQLNPNVTQTLQALQEKGAQHFVYTHKGASAQSVLDRLGIGHYFTEVITAAQGFTRKPAPDGVEYLIEKYGLDRQQCYYVGDRMIDMVCAANAQIRSILYLYSPSSHEAKPLATCCVNDLQHILELNLQ